jgi:GT2 family glycosyltransferase
MRFVVDPGSGLSGAVNAGWRAFGERCDYWTWLGDDDTWVGGAAALAMGLLDRDRRASMVFGRCRYVTEDGRVLFEARPTRLAAWLLRWGPNLVPQPGSLYRAEAVRSVGLLDESLRFAMDLDLFLRLQDAGRLRYLPEVLATFRWHAGSTTVASTVDSEAEARRVRRRTWTGHRAVGPLVAPLANGVGRVLHRLHRVPYRHEGSRR